MQLTPEDSLLYSFNKELAFSQIEEIHRKNEEALEVLESPDLISTHSTKTNKNNDFMELGEMPEIDYSDMGSDIELEPPSLFGMEK